MKAIEINRRDFLKRCGKYALLLGMSSFSAIEFFQKDALAQSAKKGFIKKKLSPYFVSLNKSDIWCKLCPRECVVAPGKRGYCEVRENNGGKYYSLVYGNPCAVNVDPIEKKPFYHVIPATGSFSIATAGCNFDCKFCQNYEISQALPEETYNFDLPPEHVVELAIKYSCRSIAYTYVEPTIFYEYMYDTCVLAREKGILNVYHSNGFINPVPLKELCRVMDAACIDLKAFTEDFYAEMCEGAMAPVLRSLKTLRTLKVHVEIVNLVIPTKNDDMAKIRGVCNWIKNELGPDVPVHFTRFYPMYKLRNLPPTPVDTLEKARNTAISEGLEYVYIGNVPGHSGENTHCPKCKNMLIKRKGYSIQENNIIRGKCKNCGKPIPGIWEI